MLSTKAAPPPSPARLYIFSDGVHEVHRRDIMCVMMFAYVTYLFNLVQWVIVGIRSLLQQHNADHGSFMRSRPGALLFLHCRTLCGLISRNRSL